jgi:uncharacterized membrane protein YozB (DUF420 family)
MLKLRLHHIITFITWAPILFFAGVLTYNSAHYFIFDTTYGLLAEKQVELRDSVYYFSFYIHVAAATVILFTPFFSFLIRITKRTRKAHRTLGKIYVMTTLVIVVPTGLYLALFAKGGLSAQWGFATQGILLGIFTWLGFRAILKGNVEKHKEWMVRSYAIAIAALTFRIYHVLFIYIGIPYNDNYAASQWLSVMGNLFLSEIAISYMRHRTKKLTHLSTPNTAQYET